MMTNKTKNRIDAGYTPVTNCKACPLECGADRTKGAGACGVQTPAVAKYYLHPFEEPCISFEKGSGTVFFTGCSLRCTFCQNYDVSRAKRGKPLSAQELADVFKTLEDMGAENVSLVTAGHLAPYLIDAFALYKPKIPVVYNSGGYEKVETLERLDPFIDVYLPDLKFVSPTLSKRYTGRADYFDVAEKALLFMAKKPHRLRDDGKLLSGVVVRHLVMPLCTSDSKAAVRWFATHMPPTAYLSLMSQYTPFGDAQKYPELQRKITAREYSAVLDEAFALGLENRLFAQERASATENYIPTWDF